MKILILILMVSFGFSTAALARQPIRVELVSVPESGLVEKVGDQVKIIASVKNTGTASQRLSLKWKYNTVAFQIEAPEAHGSFELAPGTSRDFETSFTLLKPGFVETQCEITPAVGRGIKAKRRVGHLPGIAIAPVSKQEDFEAFWQDSIAELAGIDPQFQAKRDPKFSDASIDVIEVSMQSVDGVTVRGWLEIPRHLKTSSKIPVMIHVPGYGGRVKPTGKWNRWIVFSFNPRGHGNSQDQVPGIPLDYWLRGLDQKETYFYRGAFLDCIRAVDYVTSLANVDQDRIAIVGTSQGGGLSLVTAALDGRIDFCAPDIPFLCDWPNYFKLTHWPDMNRWVEAKPDRSWGATLVTLSYFDALNFADKIRVPVFMGIGLQDTICPPTTGFSVYNKIQSPKDYRLYPDKGHGLGRPHKEAVTEWLTKGFRLH